VQGLTFGTSITYSDFSYDSYILRSISGTGAATDVDYSGKEVPSVPKMNMSFSLAYNKLLSDNVIGFAKTQFQTVGKMYVNDQNNAETEGYSLLSLTLGAELFTGPFSFILSGGGMNLLDKEYVGFININATNGRFYEAGEPRNFFGNLTISYSF